MSVVINQEQVARNVGNFALRRSQEFDTQSKLVVQNVASISWSNIRVGEVLGQGGFSDVLQVTVPSKCLSRRDLHGGNTCTSFDTTDTASLSEEESIQNSKQEGTQEVFALKRLKSSLVTCQKSFVVGILDFVMEAQMLSRLNHENIIRLHAVSDIPIDQAFVDLNSNGYFLLLDRLYGTLHDRIKKWRRQRRLTNAKKKSSKGQERLELTKRIESVALPIVKAMTYLHKNKICFRDLKPANIGFDAHGNIKLFDFGVAREIVDPDRRMTGKSGSFRYMAPEVHKKQHYGLAVDVYSFGIVLHELASLQKPFTEFNRTSHAKRVIHGHYRPSLEAWWPHKLQIIMAQCWDQDPSKRPTFETIETSLKQQQSSRNMSWKQKARKIHSTWNKRAAVDVSAKRESLK